MNARQEFVFDWKGCVALIFHGLEVRGLLHWLKSIGPVEAVCVQPRHVDVAPGRGDDAVGFLRVCEKSGNRILATGAVTRPTGRPDPPAGPDPLAD